MNCPPGLGCKFQIIVLGHEFAEQVYKNIFEET